ncbi:MAG TPA: hypothetical protein VLF69_01335 [Candidatus Saccharimonadales bacterium]|nr:hypothetical protein [Candidatus Saccharimonadales bacterium]
MPKSKPSSPDTPTPHLRAFLAANQGKRLGELSTDAQVLFGFLTLVVDIKYRNRYGKSFEEGSGESRSGRTI